MKNQVTQQQLHLRTLPVVILGGSHILFTAVFGLFLFSLQSKNTSQKQAPSISDLTSSLQQHVAALPTTPTSQRTTAVRELKQLAEQRRTLMRGLLHSQPISFLQAAMPDVEYKKFPTDVQAVLEHAVTITGQVNIAHTDYFAGHQSSIDNAFLQVADQKSPIVLYGTSPVTPLEPQSTVSVSGIQLDNSVAVQTAHLETPPPSTAVTATSQKNILVMMVAVPDVAPLPVTVAQVQNHIFTQMRDYYRENSYGKLDIVGTIAKNSPTSQGWITLPSNSDHYCDTSFLSGITNGVQDAVAAAVAIDPTLNVSTFTNIMLIGNFHCGWGGVASIGQASYWLPPYGQIVQGISIVQSGSILPTGYNSPAIHEFGHNLGEEHAQMFMCTTTSSCSYLDYGDNYDVMGSTLTPRHFNAPHKEKAGWLDATSLPLVNADGVYILQPLESTSGVRAIKIQRATDDFLYVENRQPTVNGLPTFDAGMDTSEFSLGPTDVFHGALLHYILSGNNAHPALLDPTHPPSDPADNVYSAALPTCLNDSDQACQYVDPLTHTTIRVLSRDTSGALRVKVVIGKRDFSAPSITLALPPPFTPHLTWYSRHVLLQAQASAPSGISRVDFYRTIPGGNALISSATAAPYQVDYDISSLPNRSAETVFAVAYDRSGEPYQVANNQQTSNFMVFQIDNAAPLVSILTPTAGAAVKGVSVNLSVNVTDNLAVRKVDYYLFSSTGSTLLGSATTAPYSLMWNSQTVKNGQYGIVARAYDLAGNQTTTGQTQFEVRNPTEGIDPRLIPE